MVLLGSQLGVYRVFLFFIKRGVAKTLSWDGARC